MPAPVGAEYEEAVGAPEEPRYEPPNAVMEAARSLAQPGNYDQPPQAFTREERQAPAHTWLPPVAPGHKEPAPSDGPHMVSVGGRHEPPTRPDARYSRTPDSEAEAVGEPVHQRRPRPVADRRQPHRAADFNNVVPAANVVAGAICALVSLIAIGYLVFALL